MNESEARLAEAQLVAKLGAHLRRAGEAPLSHLMMANFPCGVGRMDWSRARAVLERPAPPGRAHGANSPGGAFQTSAHVPEVVSFFTDCLRRHGITDEWVGFIGEGLESEYEIKRTAIPDLLQIVADVPDHKYIVALDGSWAFMWSFEDDLYFGLRP